MSRDCSSPVSATSSSTDDAFGVEVARPMAGRPLPPTACGSTDFGIRGVHLAYELLDGYDALILVDAVPMGEPPGTLAVIEPETAAGDDGDDERAPPVVDAHTMTPEVVLGHVWRASAVGSSGSSIVGCQPASLGEGIGLSPAVAAAVDAAVDLCADNLVGEMMEPVERGSTNDPSLRCLTGVRRHCRAGDHRCPISPATSRLGRCEMDIVVFSILVGSPAWPHAGHLASVPDIARYLRIRRM